MKESIPVAVPSAAPPPPPVENKTDIGTNKDKGEAPMDMETDEKEPGNHFFLFS